MKRAYKIRVPVAGYVEIEVEAITNLGAVLKAYNQFSNKLNPRDGVTDLDAFLGIAEMNIEAADTVQVYLCQEDVDRGIYTDYSLGVVKDEE